jgi:hypothetical protein
MPERPTKPTRNKITKTDELWRLVTATRLMAGMAAHHPDSFTHEDFLEMYKLLCRVSDLLGIEPVVRRVDRLSLS